MREQHLVLKFPKGTLNHIPKLTSFMPCTIIGNDDIDDESVFEEMMFENVLFCKSWGSKVKLERCFTRLSKIEGETRSDFVKVLLMHNG